MILRVTESVLWLLRRTSVAEVGVLAVGELVTGSPEWRKDEIFSMHIHTGA